MKLFLRKEQKAAQQFIKKFFRVSTNESFVSFQFRERFALSSEMTLLSTLSFFHHA